MKNERGITLVSLVVTIIVMAIIAGVTTYSGIESVHETKRTVFISEMEMIQAKVNVIHEKRKNNETDKEYYDSIGTDIAYVDEATLNTVLGDISREGFKQFSPNDLSKIELENVNQTVLINFDTREVVSVDGIEIDGTMYYRLQDLPDYLNYNVEYTETNTQAPTFNVQQTKIDDYTYRFTIKDIVYNSNVTGGTISYKLHSATNWILNGENTTITVEKPGLYDIKFTDSAGNSTIVQKWIYVENGLVLHLDGENNTGNGHDATTTVWKDLSGNGNDATLYNFDSTEASGWSDKSLNFDGSNDWLLTPITELTDEYTYETILNIPNIISKAEEYIFNYSPVAGFYHGIRLYSGGMMNIESFSTYDINAVSYEQYIGKRQSFVIRARKNDASNFLVNNASVLSFTSGNLSYTSSGNFLIGDLRVNRNINFTGEISAFRIYNRKLTDDEVATNYEIDQYRFGITE